MSSKHRPPHTSILAALALAVLLAVSAPSARANVYATNIKLNGGTNSVATTQGGGITISYLLNEPASAGVAVNILSGTNLLRAVTVPGGSPGALRGTNTVFWDTRDNGGSQVTGGVYSVSVTAISKGYTNWTQISPDATNYYVWAPSSLAVNLNPNSPYYGRVMIGNAANGPNVGTVVGDNDGIIKYNADGSFAEEGAYSTAGYPWTDQGFYACPQKLRIGGDDRVYALDFNLDPNGVGKVVACDMTMITNQIVLDYPNYTNNPYFFSMTYGWGVMDITDAGTTNGRIWLGDISPSSAGVWAWKMTNGVADPNDSIGTQVVSAGAGSSLQSPSGGFMVDGKANLFIGQERDGIGDPAGRVLLFTNWNGASPLTNATWAAGGGDDTFRFDSDLTVDSRLNPRFAASAMYNGLGIRILNATNGASVTNINTGVSYLATAWDNAGNLYAAAIGPGASGLHRWQVFSPPGGTNRATTPALKTVQVIAAAPPQITNITVASSTVSITFTGAVSDSASIFVLRNATVLQGPYWNADNASITQLSPGRFRATVPGGLPAMFYRILRQGAAPLPQPQITDISVANGTVTINFTALATDSPATFAILKAGLVDGPYSNAVNAVTIQLSPGVFRTTVPDAGTTQFYKVER